MPTPRQTSPRRSFRLSAVVLFVTSLVTVRPAGAADGVTPMARVRSSNPSIAALIEQGRSRSTTFRSLIETIEASDGLVYIEGGRCHWRHACLLMSMTVAGPNRILRVLVDTNTTDQDFISSIGHELRHAIEVLSDPTVTSDAAIYNFYLRTYPSAKPGEFETRAATQAGLDVRADLRKQ